MTIRPGARYRRMEDVAWDTWTPRERATLLFVVRDGHILLIRKKRGLGAGKINGPGGRIDPGESAQDGAVREVREELGIVPTGVEQVGELWFQFTDGHSILCYVFLANGYRGRPVETDEAVPLWTPIQAVPFDEMWEDDRVWMPWLLRRQPFFGRASFDGERLIGHAMGPVQPTA